MRIAGVAPSISMRRGCVVTATVALTLGLLGGAAHAGGAAGPGVRSAIAKRLVKVKRRMEARLSRETPERRITRKEGLPAGEHGHSSQLRCCGWWPARVGQSGNRPALFNLTTRARLSPDFEGQLVYVGRSFGQGFYIGTFQGKKYAVDPEWGTVRNGATAYDDIVPGWLDDGYGTKVGVGVIRHPGGETTLHALDYGTGRRRSMRQEQLRFDSERPHPSGR